LSTPSPSSGLYNRYTPSGDVLVNGAAASAYSAWFAAAAADALGAPAVALLPRLYQAALAPARALRWALGAARYNAAYARVDARLDIARTGRAGGLLGLARVLCVACAELALDAAAAPLGGAAALAVLAGVAAALLWPRACSAGSR
jgi:hypothetical protein